jgi:hypothetical protein
LKDVVLGLGYCIKDEMLRKIKQLLKKTIVYSCYQWGLGQEGKWFPAFKAKREYKKKFRKELNLVNPQTLTEKINWLKLYYYPKDSLAILAGDKWGLQTFLRERGLSELAPPILHVYDSVEDICWELLPDKFVIKKSNASGYNIVITDKKEADYETVKHTIAGWMKTPFGYFSGEHHYEKMQPKIVIEKYMKNIGKEWRIWCVVGKPEILTAIHWSDDDETDVKIGHSERGQIFSNLKGEIIDVLDYGIEEVKRKYTIGGMLELPSDFDKMIELSKILSKDFPFVRVDFYHGEDRLVLGELTFTPLSGFGQYAQSIEEGLGRKLELPEL